ncbi:MAG TPA: tRNA guanosine(34) transglycosylase Tgt [Chloroflexota bacterium]|nr:tRNA guanosine(34) transglycosylase Tgt [Chloroflexota bacterium]
MTAFSFDLLAVDARTGARAGVLHTPHGAVPTPVYMPVGTQATVKTLTPDELVAAGAAIILANTYHLSLRPGAERVARFGGLHGFMGWDRPILTDSGGFQVFSLGHLRRVDEDGVSFRSHIDGSIHRFTPERVIELQEALGADIIMPLDECLPYGVDQPAAEEALERTQRWAERSVAAQTRRDQALFGIVQGGMHARLRWRAATRLAELDLPGYAIGGLSIGESKAEMHALLEEVTPLLPARKPRYLMGVGAPEDLFECVSRGVDMFDVVLPARLARNGALITSSGRLNIRNARHADSHDPIEAGCRCYTCRHFSLGYLHHLFKAEELLSYRLATLHNVTFMVDLAAQIRASILDGSFADLRERFLGAYRPPDAAVRAEQRRRWLDAQARKVGSS